MEAAGHTVSFLHGELKPNERDQVIDDFRSGKTKVLITTNVLARGIDIQQVLLLGLDQSIDLNLNLTPNKNKGVLGDKL